MSTITANRGRAPGHGHTADDVLCDHCGLVVPTGLIEHDAPNQFCCSGCRAVFSIINGRGLDSYYAMRRTLERERKAVNRRAASYDAFDDPAFVRNFAETRPDGSMCATLALDGVHCPACVWLIERLDRVVPGVIDAKADYGRSTATVRWDPARSSLASVAKGLDSIGYAASPPRGKDQDGQRRIDARRQLVRIGVAGALAGNIMLVSVALYAGVFDGIEPRFVTLFRVVAAVLGVLSLAWPGRVFFRGAIAAVRTRTPHLDIPIAFALAVGGAWGVVNTVRGGGEIYFDSLATLVFLLLCGRFIQAQQQRRAANAVDLLLSLTPGMVRIVRGDSVEMKPVEAAEIGDIAEVHAGEAIPIDGVIVSGKSEVEQALLTGESVPVVVGEGEAVWAGASNLTSTLRVRIDAVGAETRTGKLMKLVEDAMARRAPIVARANRLAGWFVVVATLLATGTAAAWWHVSPELAMEYATALLIVTCPCALGLATPLVLSASVGRLARGGVLVKGGEQLERLSRPGVMLLDKTGTLTTGTMSVGAWTVDDDVQRRVRTLEATSTHPIGKAIAASGAHAAGGTADVEHVCGGGVRGIVGGRELAVGTLPLLESCGVRGLDGVRSWAERVAEGGQTPVLIAEDGLAVGGVALSDTARPDVRRLVAELRSAGWTLGVLSGDDPRVVRRIAEEVGIDSGRAHGRVTPEQKLEAVRRAVAEADRGAPVVMVGDGVNDAAALAAADVGISVHGGAEVSHDASDVLMRVEGLGAIALLLQSAGGAIGRIRLCIGFSLCYNVAAATLAATGMIHPLLAAVLMPFSSLTVIGIAGSAIRGGQRCR